MYETAQIADRIAAIGLAGAEPYAAEIDQHLWEPTIARLTKEGLLGLALSAVERGALRLSPPQLDELESRQMRAMALSLCLERRLFDVSEAFDAESIGFIVLKGPVLANSIYADPAWRPFVDLDILVESRRWRDSCRVLSELGFQRKLPEPSPGFDERFGKAALHTDEDALQLDLHRTLVVGPFGLWLDEEDLFRHRTSFLLGDRSLPCFDDTTLLMHACVHASLGWNPPLCLPLRDVVEICRARSIDWSRFEAFVSSARLGAVVDHTVRAVVHRLGTWIPELAGVAAAAGITRKERHVVDLQTNRDGRGHISVLTLKAIPSPIDKVRYVRSLLFPTREFLQVRAGGEAPSRLRRWTIPIEWLGGAAASASARARREDP